MIGLGSNGGDSAAPAVQFLSALISQLADPAAAEARLTEIRHCTELADKVLNNASATLAKAMAANDSIRDRERSVADRETQATAKERELKQREDALAFRERHLSDVTRQAEADGKAAADLREQLEQKLAAVKAIAA